MGKKLDTFINWALEPITEGIQKDNVYIPSDKELNYSNKLKILNINKKSNVVKENNGTFRPNNFWEYIGQEKSKEILYNYIKGTSERKRIFPHTLITGEPGMGKTALAKIIAKELKVNFEECIASNLDNIDIILEKIRILNGGVLFQDEIHSLPLEIAEKMYSLMEDFQYNGNNITPFTLIGATTEYGEMIKEKRPFCDRFKLILTLDKYSLSDLVKIAKQYREKLFKEDKVREDFYGILASNCRNTPRTLIRLLEAGIYFNGDLNKVLNVFEIIKNGFTKKDLCVLKYINLNDRGVGLQTLGSYLGTSVDNYIYNIEPYLLQNELIVRTGRGRMITTKGKEFIKILES